MDWRRLLGLWNDDPGAGDPILTAAARNAALLQVELDQLDVWELPVVVAARQLCADTTGMLRLVGLTGPDRLDPAPAVLRRPDPAEPYRTTLERIVNAMTRHGRAWLHVQANGSNGHPLAVTVVPDQRVTCDVRDGRIVARYLDGRPVSRDELRHVPMLTDDDPVGQSPLQLIRTALEQLAQVYRFSAGYYTTGNVPPYAVVHPTRLSATQARDLADQWLIARAERRPAVLSGGISVETYAQPSAADALLLDAMRNLDAIVARALLIPPSLLNVPSQSSLTYSTTQGEFQRWLTVGLYPMFLARIEAAFTDMLPRGQVAAFDTSNLTRTDMAGRIATLSQSVAAGIHTVAEARALEGLPATPDSAPVPIERNVEGL